MDLHQPWGTPEPACANPPLHPTENGFSMKWEKLAAICLWFAYYNFCRAHMTLRYPGDGSGPHGRIWNVADLLA
jgi:hypothetical protein